MMKVGRYSALGIGLFAIGCEAVDDRAEAERGAVFEPATIYDRPPANHEISAIKQWAIEGQEFTFVKYVDDEGNIAEFGFDGEGDAISKSSIPAPRREKLGASLRTTLESSDAGDLLEVVVALEDPLGVGLAEWTEQGTVTLGDAGAIEIRLDGKVVSAAELERHDATRQAHIDRNLILLDDARRTALRELTARRPELDLRAEIARADASVTLRLPSDEIKWFLAENDDLVAAIELADPPGDLLAAAMMDTRVDPHAINYAGRRGGGIGVYMSEQGCPNPGHISNYWRLAGASTEHSMNVSAIIRGVSPESFVYCRAGFVLPSASDLLGQNGNPRVHIETHSWANALSDNADYIVSDRDFDNHVYDTAVSVFVAGGNFGLQNGYASSPGKALNVISVGNYDDAIDTVNPTSSFLDPQVGNEKPELVAPGTWICAGGYCKSGTSMASPHGAGFAADLSSAYAWLRLRPSYLKALLIAGSNKAVTGGLEKVGVGGLDFQRVFYNGTNSWYEGSNNSFATFDAGDVVPNDGHIQRQVSLDASLSSVRVAISWLNRGTWIYEHRADTFPLGMDLDLCVFDPLGNLKGCSTSFDNSYELVAFDPTITGIYTVRITRSKNNDVSSKLHVGLAIDWN